MQAAAFPQNTYNLLGRVDYNLSDKTQVFFRYARYSENDFPGSTFYSPYPQYNVGATIDIDNSALFSVNHVFSSNLLSSTKTQFYALRYRRQFRHGPDPDSESVSQYELRTRSRSDYVTGNVIQLPGLENTADGSGGLPYGGPQNTLQLFQDLAWTKGRHTMHFGGEFTYIQLNVAYGAYYQANEVLGSDLGPSLNTLVNAGVRYARRGVCKPRTPIRSPGECERARCPAPLISTAMQFITPACTVTPPLPASRPRAQLPLQGLGFVCRRQLQTHSQAHAELRSALRALRRAA